MEAAQTFQLVLLPLKNFEPKLKPYYPRASACWQQVWRDLYRSAKYEKSLYLDNFLRQDEAACIFTPDECVGMILFRTVDFAMLDFRSDSYFADWPTADLEALIERGQKIFVTSFLTVNPDFRNFDPQLKFKSVFLDLMAKRFKQTDADVISGVTRCDRGINDEVIKLGAEILGPARDYMEGRFKVDLISITKRDVRESTDPIVRPFSDSLWRNRIDHLDQQSYGLRVA